AARGGAAGVASARGPACAPPPPPPPGGRRRPARGGGGGGGGGAAGAAGVPPVPDDPAVWATGRRDERVGYLTQLRDRDPAAARELLAAGWDRETGDDRALRPGVLEHGLSGADEEFLEAA